MPPNPSALTIVSSISFHYVEGGATPSDALLWKRGKSVCVYTHTIKIPAPMRSSDWLQGVTAQLTRVKGRQAGRQAGKRAVGKAGGGDGRSTRIQPNCAWVGLATNTRGYANAYPQVDSNLFPASRT